MAVLVMVGMLTFAQVDPLLDRLPLPQPTFQNGFKDLAEQLGAETIGYPLEDEHPAPDAEAVQRTTRGLAVWKKGQPPSFTNGAEVFVLEPGLRIASSLGKRADLARFGSSVWDRLAACEASGIWSNASNPRYKGGLQMDATFWARYGGLAFAPAPHLASREQQIQIAQRGQAVQGWNAWPTCSRRLGLR